MDEDRACYFLETNMEAEKQKKMHPGTAIADPKTYTPKQYCTDLYAIGIDTIHVIKGRKKYDAVIEEKDCAGQFYNHKAEGALHLFIQTGKAKYLRELAACRLLVPVQINPRRRKHAPVLHYSYAASKSGREFYIVFTTIQEFEAWNEKQEQKSSPLETDLHKMSVIRKGMDLIINPLSFKLVLSDGFLKKLQPQKAKR